MRLTVSQVKVLEQIYYFTDCCNEVYDWALLHWTQERIADTLPDLVESIAGCVSVDGNGFMVNPERYGRGFRLKQAGYEALTELDPERHPKKLRRFGGAT